MEGYRYNFPLTKEARTNTRRQQYMKVLEEFCEFTTSYVGGDIDHALEELVDLSHAVEGLLFKFDRRKVDEKYREVLEKNRDRGYY